MVTPQDGHSTQSQRRRVAVREARCLLVKLRLDFRQFLHKLDEKEGRSMSHHKLFTSAAENDNLRVIHRKQRRMTI